MHRFWEIILQPLFDILQPLEIIEIGADHGFNTRNILAYCRQKNAHAHIIDPLPKFDPDALKKEYGEAFTFYPALSLNALPLIRRMDAVLIDGDHNWYTVYHELKLIEQQSAKSGSVFPLIFIHDVAWPYARRDLYYCPDRIPEAYRKPYSKKGIDPGGVELVEKRGMNPHLYNAISEQNFRNGVLTAVEDFIKETDLSIELIKIPIFHGLGILYCASLKTSHPLFAKFIHNLTTPSVIAKLFQAVEKSRIQNILATEQANQQFRDLEKTRRQEVDEHQRELHKSRQQIEILDEKIKNEARQLNAEIKTIKIRMLELEDKHRREGEALESQIKQYHQKLEQNQQELKALTQLEEKIQNERDQLSNWMKQLRVQFESVLQSRRWKLGHALVGIVTLSRFRKKFTMASDHMVKIFQQFDSKMNENALDIVLFWKQNDTGIYGRRSDMLIKYLSRRPQIRKIIVFDMPIAIDILREKSKNKGLTHDRKVYKETLLRNRGSRDSEKVSFHTFIFSTDKKDTDLDIGRYPDHSEYMNFIEDRLNESNIQPNQAVFWFYPLNSNIPKIVQHFKPKIKVIDLVDDHRAWSEVSMIKRLYLTKHYKDVLKIGDLVLANSLNVQQSMQRYHPDIKLIPNGCELEPPPDLSNDGDFQKFKKMPGVKIGYVGNLEKDKIDIHLIQYMAEKRPAWNIILIGSTHANPQVLELNKFSNIHFMGVIKYPDVRAWIKELNVAILPHLNSKKTRSMNPLKLYVYCSLGVPVVSTDIENLDELKSFILIADTYDDFILKVEKSLEKGNKSTSVDLRKCLEKNSWDSRVDQILKELGSKIE